MTAGAEACTCSVCEVVCTGRFGGCADVWARGPQPVHIVELEPTPPSPEEVPEPVMDEAPPPEPEEAQAPPPAPGRDPATEVLLWLRGEFDYVNGQIQALSDRLARQEAAVRAVAETRQEELEVSLAELEGCAAQLRNEAAGLREMRAHLAQSLPQLVAEAAAPAVTDTVSGAVAGAVAEVRAAVAELGGALSEVLPRAVAQAVTPPAPAEPAVLPPPAEAAVAGPDDAEGTDPLSQLHQAQDEAAEWFMIVVDEAVRRAVERHLPPAAGAAAPPAGPAEGVRQVSSNEPEGDQGAGVPAPEGLEQPPEQASEPAPEGAGTENGRSAPSDASPRPVPAAAEEAVTTAGVAPPEPQVTALTADVVLAEPIPPDGDPAAPAASWADHRDEVEPERASTVACVLPGVAVGPSLALGVSAAVRRARLRRRRRRRAGAPIAGLHRRDPFVGDLTSRLERFALSRRDLALSPNGAEPTAGADVVAVLGEQDDREVGVPLGQAPLGMVGPGAADAGRALVTTLLAGTDPGAVRVLAVGDVLPSGPSFPGLQRVDDMETVLGELEGELGRRRHRSPEGPASPVEPLLVLVTADVPEALSGRLAALLREGPAVGLTAVGVGCELDGAETVTLQPGAVIRSAGSGGRLDTLAGTRLFTLSPGAADELLRLLCAARTDEEGPLPEAADEPFPVLATSAPPPIEVRLLGAYQIEANGKEIRSGLRAKARELLAFYLLHPEGTTLDAATEALWPEADPGRGSEWFWTALGNLRTTLRRATGIQQLRIIERDSDRYRVEPVFGVDLWEFQAALPKGTGANPGDPEWAAALENAANLYGGELLAGVDWAWVEVPRDDLRRRAVDVLVSLAATRLVAGDVRSALDVLSRAVEIDPVAEQLYRRIMRLHARQSRPDEVAATFRRLEARLGELDLEPTPESRQLVEELCGAPAG
ncbi:MAG TPA: BTAD domain-containing putative transcriptional regulator [Acidimicrobiales bacterium]|nr:BTAD domain-containing putative transcriptional regulator [Acidimicrobiales bacterium]